MKSSNKSSIITGTILLSLAAVFSICLLLQLLDFGIGGPGHNNIFYYIGAMLTTVYGFSSILIPLFLLISGLYCFATIWTAQKTMRLITAIVPFFTCVVTEKICRGALTDAAGTSGVIKAVIAGITGLMLVIIEILGAGIIAESVNRRIFYKGKASPEFSEYDYEDETSDQEDIDIQDDEDDLSEGTKDSADSEKSEASEEDGQFKFEKIRSKKTVFDKAFDKLKKKKKDDSFEALMESAEELYDSDIPSIEDYENIEAKEQNDSLETDEAFADAPVNDDFTDVFAEEGSLVTQTEQPAQTEEAAPVEKEAPEASEPAEEEQKNPASIISQEEYAALLSEDTQPSEPSDELEWTNLPPAPETLPPEYTEDFDENDPALSFPPAETEKAADSSTGIAPATASAPATTEEDNNSPYAASRYIDKVVPNPAYPYGISLNDEESEDNQNEPAVTADNHNENAKKYPRKILFERKPKAPAPENENEADSQNNIGALDPDFFDIDMNDVQNDEELSDDVQQIPDEMEVGNTVFRQIANQEKNDNSVNFSKLAGNVFADMEEDIRRDSKDSENNDIKDLRDDDAFDFDEEEEKQDSLDKLSKDSLDLEPDENSPELNPNAGHANNLTADELTDFFNAQQEENTPQHKVIEGPAPKSHKATKKGPYVIPSNLLTAYKDDQYWIIDDETKQASVNLKQTLAEFNIDADIIGIKKGPVVTMFEILPAPGVKLSKIVALQDNIALSLAAQSVRIVAPIPGKQAVGIEVPNKRRSVVGFREIIEMDLPEWNKMKVPVILGKDILGKAQLVDLVKTPHMLIAGATGSGKSVCVNSLILSILYKRSFKDVKMILVDPKVVELKLYNNIPHLLTPVITEPKKAIQALQYCLCEMERRYALLDGLGVRDISSYNERIVERNICTEKLPYIVVIIDEFADLMATSGKELENIVARLTAMSRAVGIHLVLATQRPSTNVITGLIKANIPSRIAFMVASRIDSQIIIDGVGAEKLLGRGDMLYASAVDPAPIRIQGTYLDDNEVEKVVDYVKQYGEPEYIDDEIFVEDDEDEEGNVDLFGNSMDEDPLYDQALEIVVQSGKASASYIQRRLKIGYNRAARLVEEMEERGIVGPANGSKPREIIHIPG